MVHIIMDKIKKSISLLIIILISLSFTACRSYDYNLNKDNTIKTSSSLSENLAKENTPDYNEELIPVDIIIDSDTFSAKLYTNNTTLELIKQFPITINMKDMNDNEKYYYMSSHLTQNKEEINDIKSGDIMLYGNDCIVIFYEDFETFYKYTRLGYIEDKDKLINLLRNNKDVKVTFELNIKI